MLKARVLSCFAALVAAGLFAPAAFALPGMPLAEGQQWLATHAVFPGDHYFELPDGYGSYLSLNRGQELVLSVHYNLAPLIKAPKKVLYERLSLFRSQETTLQPCRQTIGQGAGATGFMVSLTGESINTVLPECLRLTAINFLDRSAPDTIDALRLAYGAQSPLIADFRNAALIGDGVQAVTLDWDASGLARSYAAIRPGPIRAQVYSGEKYDYLLTRNTLTVVYKDEPGYWNDWETLAEIWNQHAAKYAEIRDEQRVAGK
jgi:hypothetical protein